QELGHADLPEPSLGLRLVVHVADASDALDALGDLDDLAVPYVVPAPTRRQGVTWLQMQRNQTRPQVSASRPPGGRRGHLEEQHLEHQVRGHRSLLGVRHRSRVLDYCLTYAPGFGRSWVYANHTNAPIAQKVPKARASGVLRARTRRA